MELEYMNQVCWDDRIIYKYHDEIKHCIDPLKLNIPSKQKEIIKEIFNIKLDKLKRININNSNKCGIYCLFMDKKIVYIGKSVNIDIRVNTHNNEDFKVFDEYSYIEVDEKHLDVFERILINKYLPKYNKDSSSVKVRNIKKYERR